MLVEVWYFTMTIALSTYGYGGFIGYNPPTESYMVKLPTQKSCEETRKFINTLYLGDGSHVYTSGECAKYTKEVPE